MQTKGIIVPRQRRDRKPADSPPRPGRVLDGPGTDPLETRLPDREYPAVFVRQESKKTYGRQGCWYVHFQISEPGLHQGKRLLRIYRKPRGRAKRSSSLRSDYERVTRRRYPLRGSVSPADFLAECEVLVRTRTVERDSKGVERPDALRYSVVDAVLELRSGTPPCLRKT